jgi:cytochrome c peroxidase
MASAVRYNKILFVILSLVVLFVSSCRKDPKITPADTSPYSFDYPEIISEYLPPIQTPSTNLMTNEGVELGRKLFYDERLSANNTQSCGSCHLQSASFSDTSSFSLGIDGVAGNRNSMPLINLGWMNSFFWDGRAAGMENQVYQPVTNPIEMHSTWPDVAAKLQQDALYPALFLQIFGTNLIDSVLVSKAISQFMRTLISGNAPFDKYLMTGSSGWNAVDEQMAYEGFTIFMDESKGDCFHCHGDSYNPLWTDNSFHNNGLDITFTDNGRGAITGNTYDNGKFKTPTLRNLVFTAPYMHDGRFTTLQQVINHYSQGLQNSATIDPLMKHIGTGGSQMNPGDKSKLLMFLISLSDSSFVSDPKFSDPG